MSLVTQRHFWRTSLYTGLLLAALIYAFAWFVPETSVFSSFLSGVAGWALLLAGLTMLVSLMFFLKNRRGIAAGILFGIVIAIVFLLILGSVLGVSVLFGA